MNSANERQSIQNVFRALIFLPISSYVNVGFPSARSPRPCPHPATARRVEREGLGTDFKIYRVGTQDVTKELE